MSGKLKAALIVGGVLLALNLGSGFLCQLCPMALYLIGGVVTGWLVIRWTDTPPKSGMTEGALAGLLAGAAGFFGQLISIIGNVSIFAATGFVNPFTGQELLTDQERAIGVGSGIGVWSCAGLVTVAIMVIFAALAAKLAADRKWPAGIGPDPRIYELGRDVDHQHSG